MPSRLVATGGTDVSTATMIPAVGILLLDWLG